MPYLVMKAAALGRGKPKDAYDIYHIINNFSGGVRALVKEFMPCADRELIRNMCEKLGEKFASEKHAGPVDVVAFLDIEDREEQKRIKQDAYQKVHFLVDKLQV